MDRNALVDSLVLHEGVMLTLYNCPSGHPTIGVGHNLNTKITYGAAMQILSDDIERTIVEMNRLLPNWTKHNDARQNVLIEMAFNMGAAGLAKFRRMLLAMDIMDYAGAAQEMLASKWAEQVGQRARTLSAQMRTGKLPE